MKLATGLIGSVSGSQGGLTASHNRGGAYLRTRVIPTDPLTTRQATVRGIFGGLVSRWTNILTPLQRAGWDTYGNLITRTDTLGNSYTLTGQQAFLRCNTARIQAALAFPTTSWGVIDDAPAIADLGTPASGIISATMAATLFTIAVDIAGGAADDGGVFISVGQPVNVSRNFYKGPWRLASVQDDSDLTAGDLTTSVQMTPAAVTSVWPGPYGPIAVGSRVPLKINVAYSDGRYSSDFISFATVTV